MGKQRLSPVRADRGRARCPARVRRLRRAGGRAGRWSFSLSKLGNSSGSQSTDGLASSSRAPPTSSTSARIRRHPGPAGWAGAGGGRQATAARRRQHEEPRPRHRPPRRRGRWYLRPGGTPGPATVRAPSDGRLSKAPAYGRSSHPRQGRRSRTWTTFAARMDAAPLPGAITGPHRTGCRPLPLQRRGWGPISAATSAASAGVAASAARSSSAQALGVADGCGPATRVVGRPDIE